MKTILVLTDFSENARHAAETAALLGEALHASLLLLNCYPKIPVVPNYMGGVWIAEAVAGGKESKEKMDQLIRHLEDYITDLAGPNYRPPLVPLYAEGDLGKQLSRLITEKRVELIVMGLSAEGAIDHILKGNTTDSVIHRANCPVLIVPPKTNLDQLGQVVFATNFEKEDMKAIIYLLELGKLFYFKVKVVHVIQKTDGNQQAMLEKENAFKKLLSGLDNPGVTFIEIDGEKVVDGLTHICKQTRADLLAMTHHQYSFFERLFHSSTTKKALRHQKIPLMIFPLNNIDSDMAISEVNHLPLNGSAQKR